MFSQIKRISPVFVRKHRLFLSMKISSLKMPEIMEAKEGIVDIWFKNEGEEFKSGENLCQVTLDGLTVAISGPENGYLAKILVQTGKTVPINTSIADYALNHEEFLSYRENLRIADHAATLLADATRVIEESNKKPDTMILLREIKHLIRNGDIEENSQFAKKLQVLARKGDAELMSIFEASFDGIAFDTDSFDKKFFLSNAADLLKEKKD